MDDELTHHGILGQKWGVRRFQNQDGSLTAAGERRYGQDEKPKESGSSEKSGDGKKVAAKIAVGAAVVAGTVLAAYAVKQLGGKNVSELAPQADIGKAVVEKVLKDTALTSTPVSQLPTPKVESREVKQVVEKVIQSAPKTTPSAPVHSIPNTYDFATLMRQNDDLLKQMYANFA